eukprot:828179-Prymnesium_polylepis.1
MCIRDSRTHVATAPKRMRAMRCRLAPRTPQATSLVPRRVSYTLPRAVLTPAPRVPSWCARAVRLRWRACRRSCRRRWRGPRVMNSCSATRNSALHTRRARACGVVVGVAHNTHPHASVLFSPA